MKKYVFLILSLVLLFGARSTYAKSQVLYLEPQMERTVPVYSVSKSGQPGKAITSIYPGDFVTLKEMRKMKDGKMWFIIKGKNERMEDVELALDPKSLDHDPDNPENAKIFVASKGARKIFAVGMDNIDTYSEPGIDPEICKMGLVVCQSVSPGTDVEIQETALVLTSEGESKLKWRNYYKNKDGQWINAGQTSDVNGIYSNFEPEDPNCQNRSGPFDDLNKLANQASDLVTDQQLDLIMKNVGDCHKKMGGQYHTRVIEKVGRKNLPVLYKEIKKSDGSVQIGNADRSDWVSIDVLARTIYGEMASCFNKGLKYPEVVAKVILNRVDFKNETNAGSRFISSDDDSAQDYRNDITNAAFKSFQFSVWNREDPARRMAMCPPSRADEPYWKGTPPGKEELKIWRQAVRIASEAVLQGQTFRKRTKDLTALYYTSNMDMPKKDYKEIAAGSIGGQKLGISRCIQLWKERKLSETHPEYGIFHRLMRRALLVTTR